MKKVLQAAVLMLMILSFAGIANAHEFILKPTKLTVKKGQTVPFSVVSAHVFMVSEEMEPLDKVETTLILNGKSTPIALTANEPAMTLEGAATPAAEGTAILAGHRKGMIWTQTTSGWKQASKKGLSGVIKSGMYEKFCKTFLTVGKNDNSFAKPVGQRLEIIPLTNPALAHPGDEIEFKVLFDGKPLSVDKVLATYDGFTKTPNTYAYFTEPYGEGLAKVKVSHPGIWMVRVEHAIAQPTDDYDSLAMRSVLVFEVK